MTTVFVYAKDGKIKVHNWDYENMQYTKRDSHYKLLSQGWIHTATINVCEWMEHLYNESDIIKAVKQLGEKP